ncbi:MAG: hypothetical protein HRU75_01675 [Planctomycetia bacterium]|nr:MAG: hypothetical protein HRU75_01675 [Planctomycetia bacterium]
MLPELPERTLLLTDAGLVGYRVLTRLQNCGHAFIVRVGRNVTLLRKLGYHLRDARGRGVSVARHAAPHAAADAATRAVAGGATAWRC